MKKIVLFLGCCLLGWGTTDLLAQQGYVTAGGLATGAGGSVSYSIGQLDYLSASGSGGSLTQGLQQPNGGHSLTGTLTYDNAMGSVLTNSTVQLKQGNTVVSSATTDAAGFYQFINPETGTFHLDGSTTKPWGSVNAVDALFILKHFTGMNILTGLKLVAADVDGSNYVNASDALICMKRFVGLQSSFLAGDWAFEHPQVIITGAGNMNVDFKGICFGDVDGSYEPAIAKPQPTLYLVNEGVQTMDQYQTVTIPVRVKQAMSPAAMSLSLNYPESAIEILGVTAAYDNQTLVYHAVNGELRIAWCTLQPKALSAEDVLFNITLKLKSGSNAHLAIEMSPESSLADFQGSTLVEKSLSMPSLVNGGQGFSLSQNIPNPFNATSQITYVLPEDGYVKLELLNVVGQQIAVLQEGQQASGSHQYTVDGNSLTDGVYFYRMMVTSGSQQYSQTKRMVVSR